MLDRNKILAAFRLALSDTKSEKWTPRAVALTAHRLYGAGLGPHEKLPSAETFRKFASGRQALPEVVESLRAAQILPVERIPLDRARLLRSFEEALKGIGTATPKAKVRALRVAHAAHEIYLRESSLQPSRRTFEKLLYGKTADLEIRKLLQPAVQRRKRKTKRLKPVAAPRARLDRQRLLAAFRESVRLLETEILQGRAKALQVARKAHALYVAADRNPLRPSPHAFVRLLYGKTADPEIQEILEPTLKRRDLERRRLLIAKPPSKKRARLDRGRLREVFREAVKRLESRLVLGQARPLQVARRAYALYTRDEGAASLRPSPHPSPHTFQRLIYGKGADSEIMTLIRAALKGEIS